MSTTTESFIDQRSQRSVKSFGSAIDRWIYVYMAASFIAIVLAGFIPDSLTKIELVRTGQRPPFSLVLHLHAILMGAFLLLLLAQTTLAAVGRQDYHQRLGLTAMVLAPAIVVVGFILVPTTYYEVWNAAQMGPPEAQDSLQGAVRRRENTMLLQLRTGILFSLFLVIALRARTRDSGLHKRMMILAVASTLGAGFARITWLPHTMPDSPLSIDLYTLLIVSPMIVWDIVRNRSIHKAYVIWLMVAIPVAILLHGLWDTESWHATARQIFGV